QHVVDQHDVGAGARAQIDRDHGGQDDSALICLDICAIEGYSFRNRSYSHRSVRGGEPMRRWSFGAAVLLSLGFASAAHAAGGQFEAGLTDAGWSGANWIRRPTNGNDFTDDYTLARKSFPALSSSPVTRARVYASAMGQYDIHVNGKTVGRGDNWDYPTEG